MIRAPVSSSNLRSVGYDSATAALEVEFVSGDVYQYTGVSARLYESLLRAPSVGKFFHAFIRNAYAARQAR